MASSTGPPGSRRGRSSTTTGCVSQLSIGFASLISPASADDEYAWFDVPAIGIDSSDSASWCPDLSDSD
jgi:hypothetical protein